MGVYLVFGIGDYLFQRWQYQKEMRMTREELRRELREEEGSPEIKAALKELIGEKE